MTGSDPDAKPSNVPAPKEIGILEYIAPRDVWEREDTDMTPWLATPLGIAQFDQAIQIGIDPDTVRNEQPVTKGDTVFWADITATTVDGRTVVIENQLEKSDHSHLGQLLTYLANTDDPANSIGVWVTPRPLAEHVQAVEMINRHSELDLLLVEVAAIRVDGGKPTPIFTQITGPKFTIKKASATNSNGRADACSAYWNEFVPEAATGLSSLKLAPGTYRSPYLARTISGPSHLALEVWVTSKEHYAHIIANSPDAGMNARILDALVEHIESQAPELATTLETIPPEGRRSAVLRTQRVQGGYKDFNEDSITAHIKSARALWDAAMPLPDEFDKPGWADPVSRS